MAEMPDNTSSWNAFVNKILDAPDPLQHLFNIGMQAVKWPITNKWRPELVVAMSVINRSMNQKIDNPAARSALAIAADLIHTALTEWMKPNLGGIVIEATNETQGRQIDISENMIIIQSGGSASREYNTDNSAPHPRTWHVEGYLSQNLPWVDEGFILRPTLVLQQAMLDAYAVSRRPVFYRSGLCPWPTKVLVESYELGRQIEGTQAYQVSIELREFVTYTVPFYKSQDDTTAVDDPTTGNSEATPAAEPELEQYEFSPLGMQGAGP